MLLGAVGLFRAGANAELADGRRLWRPTHNFWFDYREEVRWLNKQRCGVKYLKIKVRSKSCKAYMAARPHSAHEIDRMIHERLRLGIISALAANESLTSNELKHTVKTTDGNLSVHARKLEDAGYISCSKSFERPHAEDRVQPDDRRASRSGTLSRSHGSFDRTYA